MDLTKLRQLIIAHFDKSELRDLCFDLKVDYESLSGEGKKDKARELIGHFGRRESIPELIVACAQRRPKVPWGDVFKEPAPLSLSAEQAPKVFHNLPRPDYLEFVGRKQEVERLYHLLSPHNRAWVIMVEGIGGIGKSALALEVAYHYLEDQGRLSPAERFAAIIWASAKSSVLTADGIIPWRQTIRTLEDIYTTISNTLEREDIIRAQPEEQDRLVSRALSQQRTLLVIDDLETIDDERVNTFLRDLPAPTKAIVTTRQRIDVAYPVRLIGMSKEDGLALIARECEKKSVTLTAAETKELYEHTGGVPLAVVWSVAQMGYGYGVEATMHKLEQPTNDIARFCFDGLVEHIHGTNAHRLAMALSLFATDASRETLGHVAGLEENIPNRDEGLATLERLSLLNKQADRFSLLPLTRSYLAHELEQVPEFKQAVYGRMVSHYRQIVAPPPEAQVGDPYWDGLANYALAENLEHELMLNDAATAERILAEASATVRGSKDKARVNYELAALAEHKGELRTAQRLGTFALEQFTRLRHKSGIEECQELLNRLEDEAPSSIVEKP